MEPLEAALRGSREIGFTIVSISISLVAVFIPIFFMPGVIGLLFHEFAVVVSLAIMVSAMVSLTLVPMLCEPLPAAARGRARTTSPLGRPPVRARLHAVLDTYARMLDWSLAHRFWC
jgi:HAE1 family hydrophobic/amphiphilic exporter-1